MIAKDHAVPALERRERLPLRGSGQTAGTAPGLLTRFPIRRLT